MTTFNPQGPLAGKNTDMPGGKKKPGFWQCCPKTGGGNQCMKGHYYYDENGNLSKNKPCGNKRIHYSSKSCSKACDKKSTDDDLNTQGPLGDRI